MAVFNPAYELRKLEEKVANSKEDEVCTSWLLLPKTAVREAGWDQALVKEAIERGEARKEGKDVGEASWEDLEEERLDAEAAKVTQKAEIDEIPGLIEEAMSGAPEVPGSETTETKQEAPSGLPGVSESLPASESDQLKKLREEGLELPKDQLWDCPNCKQVNCITEGECPQCTFPLRRALQLELEWKQLKERVVKQETGLDIGLAEQKLLDASEEKREGTLLPEKLDPSTADIEAALQEKAAEVADTDSRKRVLVSEEVGWLCGDCDRVWPIDYSKCLVCHPEEAEKYDIPTTPPTIEHRSWDDILKEQAKKKAEQDPVFPDKVKIHPDEEESVPEDEKLPDDADLSEEVRKSNMTFSDKALLLLQLKSKEKPIE